MYYVLTFKYNGVISISKNNMQVWAYFAKGNTAVAPCFSKSLSVWDSDDDETSVNESLWREAAKKQAMEHTKLEIQKALAEDSTIYEYDCIYGEVQKKKKERK